MVWLALVALTLFGFFSSEASSRTISALVLGIGLVKFFLIFYEFMDMRHAHRAWLAAMALFMLVLAAG